MGSYRRPSNIDGARHAWAMLALLVRRLRHAWPGVRIIFRSASGCCRWRRRAGCEHDAVGDRVGLAKNARLQRLAEPHLSRAAQAFTETGHPPRRCAEVDYAAERWDRSRRVLVNAEPSDQGAHPRCVVTNLSGAPQFLDATGCCARGERQNRIKEQPLELCADRTSCHAWWANQLRLLLARWAYLLRESLRRRAWSGTGLAQACVGTLRLQLLKIGAVIPRNTRRIPFLLSSAYSYQTRFRAVVVRLNSG